MTTNNVSVCETIVASTFSVASVLSYIIAGVDQHRAYRCGNGLCWGKGLIGVNCGQERDPLRSDTVCVCVCTCACVWFVPRMGGVGQGFLLLSYPQKKGASLLQNKKKKMIKVKAAV